MIELDESRLLRWKALLEEMQRDREWLASFEANMKRREASIASMNELLEGFLSEGIDVEELRATFDQKTRTEWLAFGFSGLSGAMFLNKLVKHIADKADLSSALRSVLAAPSDDPAARDQMASFGSYLDRLIGEGTVTRGQIQPTRFAFFVSAWWHLQSRESWPIFYESGRKRRFATTGSMRRRETRSRTISASGTSLDSCRERSTKC